jgi:pimeloyl-ACP methyl ester carboxylesterase
LIESVDTFGPDQQLVGTLCTPDQVHEAPIACLMFNAGVISRIGPHRFNVKLARQLAQRGIHSLRFDLSGQGDSRTGSGNTAHEARVVHDIQAAMDHVSASTGITCFVIAGICSGAFAGFAVAQQDPRIVGLWMMDGHAYVTLRSRLARHWLQVTRAFSTTMRSWTSKPLDTLLSYSERPQSATAEVDGFACTRHDYALAMQRLVDRGVHVYLMFSSDVLWRYSYQRQFHDTFKTHAFADKIKVDHLLQVDHTLTSLQAQQDVIARICQWAGTLVSSPR